MQTFFWILAVVFVLRMAVDAWVIGSRIYQNLAREPEYQLYSVHRETHEARLSLLRAEGEIGFLESYVRGEVDRHSDFVDERHWFGVIEKSRDTAVAEGAQATQRLRRIAEHGRDFVESRALAQGKTLRKFGGDLLILCFALALVPLPWL